MSEIKVKKQHVKKPPRVKKPKPVQNRCYICEDPCTPEKKAHDGCIHRQQKRAKRSAVKMKEAKKKEVVSEEAQVKAEEQKQAKAKAEPKTDAEVFGQEGN